MATYPSVRCATLCSSIEARLRKGNMSGRRPRVKYGAPFEMKLLPRLVVPELGPCLEYQGGRHPAGYGQMTFLGQKMYAHRHAYELVYGAVPRGLFVLHRCDNPPCCEPKHLYAGTRADNTRDMVERGRNHVPAGGESHRWTKLTDAQIRWAREQRAAGWLLQAIADELDVDESYMSRICRDERRAA